MSKNDQDQALEPSINTKDCSENEAESVSQARAARLKSLLKENNFKQVDVVKQIKASKGSVSKWLKGTAEPSHRYRTQLALMLNVSEDWLLYGAEASELDNTENAELASVQDELIDNTEDTPATGTTSLWADRYITVDEDDDLQFFGRVLASSKGKWRGVCLTYFLYVTPRGALIGSKVECSTSKDSTLHSSAKVFGHKSMAESLNGDIVEFFGKNPVSKQLYMEAPFNIKHSITIL